MQDKGKDGRKVSGICCKCKTKQVFENLSTVFGKDEFAVFEKRERMNKLFSKKLGDVDNSSEDGNIDIVRLQEE